MSSNYEELLNESVEKLVNKHIVIACILFFIQLFLNKKSFNHSNMREKDIIKSISRQIKFLPEFITTFPLNIIIFFIVFTHIYKFIF